MIIKDAFSITTSKFSLVYQVILVLLIAMLFFGIIGYAILAPTLNGYVNDLKGLGAGKVLKDYIKSIFMSGDGMQQAGENAHYQALVDTVRDIGVITKNHVGSIWGGIIAIIVLTLLFSVFYNICLYTVTDTLHTFMSSDSEYGFLSNLIANIKKSFKFSLAYVGMFIVSLIIVVGLSLGLGFLLSALNNFLGIVVAYITALLLISIQRALFAGWMPAYIVSDLTIKESLAVNFKKAGKRFKDQLGVYFVLYLSTLILGIIVGICTLGFGIIIVWSLCAVLSQAHDMVDYYHYKGKKYYRDQQHVVDPTKKYKEAVLEIGLDEK
ncbi:MAG: hypothetical protein HFE34_01405 [Clostridia bacterium]|nr:hypothetical protein [Clostridia bacterium]